MENLFHRKNERKIRGQEKKKEECVCLAHLLDGCKSWESFLYPIESAYWVGCFCWSSNVSIDPDDSMLVCIVHNKSLKSGIQYQCECLYIYESSSDATLILFVCL